MTSNPQTDRRRMRKIVKHVPVRLEARMQGAKIAVRDLLSLRCGDVISLDLSLQKPVEVQVNGQCKFSCDVIATGTSRGILVGEKVGMAH